MQLSFVVVDVPLVFISVPAILVQITTIVIDVPLVASAIHTIMLNVFP
jgi:hypothetical protein